MHTSYILYLSIYIFSMTCDTTKGYILVSEQESLILTKNITILKLEECLDHGNGGGYILAARIYEIPNKYGKTDSEGNSTEGNTCMKP